LGPLKLAQLKPEFRTLHPSSRRKTEEERTRNKKAAYQLIINTVEETFHGFLRERKWGV
jgi:hypothetical protein